MIFGNIFLLLQLAINSIVFQWIYSTLCIKIFNQTEHRDVLTESRLGVLSERTSFAETKAFLQMILQT